MKSFPFGSARILVATIVGLAATTSQGVIIYQNDFEAGVAPEFSPAPITTAPNNSTRFLGQFSGDTPSSTTLTLTGLAAHGSVTLNLDLYIIHSWDGTGNLGSGPDIMDITADSTTLLHASFSNWSPTQSYSDETPLGGGPFNGKTGADAENTLGYGDFFGTNTTYNLSFTFSHTSSSLAITFQGIGLQGVGDESWGIDNVVVSSTPVPEPTSCATLAIGALAIARRRRLTR